MLNRSKILKLKLNVKNYLTILQTLHLQLGPKHVFKF